MTNTLTDQNKVSESPSTLDQWGRGTIAAKDVVPGMTIQHPHLKGREVYVTEVLDTRHHESGMNAVHITGYEPGYRWAA